jgi:hypothetical protein
MLDRMLQVWQSPSLNYICMGRAEACADPSTWAFVRNSDVAEGIHNIQFCDRFFDASQTPGEGLEPGDVSAAGVIVHEVAHLAGAIIPAGLGELPWMWWDGVVGVQGVPELSWLNADSYRYYVMNVWGQ